MSVKYILMNISWEILFCFKGIACILLPLSVFSLRRTKDPPRAWWPSEGAEQTRKDRLMWGKHPSVKWVFSPPGHFISFLSVQCLRTSNTFVDGGTRRIFSSNTWSLPWFLAWNSWDLCDFPSYRSVEHWAPKSPGISWVIAASFVLMRWFVLGSWLCSR